MRERVYPPHSPCAAGAASVIGGVKVEEDKPREEAEDKLFDDLGHLVAPDAAVVDVEGDHGHGASERHQADRHPVVQAC